MKAHYAKTTKAVASFTQHKTAEVYKQNMLYKGEWTNEYMHLKCGKCFKDKLVMSAATLPHIMSLSDCYLIMKCKEQPPLVGVCIHCMDWTGLDYWTGLTFKLTFELSFFLSMINIAVV